MNRAGRWGDLLPRIVSGVVMIALALGATLGGGTVFVAFWLAAAVAVVWEWQRLVDPFGHRLPTVCAALALVGAGVTAGMGDRPVVPLLALACGAAACAALAPVQRFMAAAGVAYAGALLLSIVWLRGSMPFGLRAVFWLFAVVWGTDILAYFGGRLIRGPKLSPRWSPKKTWSGFLVGVFGGALAGCAVAPAGTSQGVVFLVGLMAAALAQAGDIAESAMKRHYKVKDSSNLIPGHGGVMDRLDGFVTATVFACTLGAARSGLGAASLGLLHWS